MSSRIYTFGEKVPIQVDKLDGLRIGSSEPYLRIRGWDELTWSGKVEGILHDGANPLWSGIVLDEAEILEVFSPFANPHRDMLKTIAMRRGNYGKPRLAGLLRLETQNAVDYTLMLTSSGEQRVRSLAELSRIPERLRIDLSIGGKTTGFSLYEEGKHATKIRKVLEKQ